MKANVLLQNIKLLDSEGVCYPEYDDASFPSKRNSYNGLDLYNRRK